MDYKDILSDLAARVEAARTERPTAGTRFRLMGLVADMAEVTEMIQREVLEVVSREAVLEADADMDFEGMAAAVLEWELRVGEPGDQVSEAAEQVNVALGVLSGVLAEVAEQLARRHSDEEYERLRAKYDYARPFTKESLLYRELFEKYYPGQAEMIADFWMPNKSWAGCDVNDPSARVLANYGASGT